MSWSQFVMKHIFFFFPECYDRGSQPPKLIPKFKRFQQLYHNTEECFLTKGKVSLKLQNLIHFLFLFCFIQSKDSNSHY